MSITSRNGSQLGFPGGSGPLKAEVQTPPDGDTPEALPGRVERYAVAHARAVDMADFVLEYGGQKGCRFTYKFFTSLARKLKQCGDFLIFRQYTRLNKVRLHAANFCQVHHLCPLCAIRRASKLVRKYLERFQLLLVEHPKATGYFVTLTLKDGADIVERHGQLRYAIQRLQKDRYDEKLLNNEMLGVLGGVGAFEFKRGAGSQLWHVHYHGIWLSSGEIDKFALSARWKVLTGDSFILDVRPLYGDSTVDAFLECFKYSMKFHDLSLSDNYEAYRVLARSKLVRSFGVFYGIDAERLEDEGPIPEDEPYIELYYRFLAGVGYSFVPSHEKRSGGAEASGQATPVAKIAENRS